MCTKTQQKVQKTMRDQYKTPEKHKTVPYNHPPERKRYSDAKIDFNDVKISLFSL